VTVSAGCFFTCAITGLGNSGTVKANVAVTDSVGNPISALGIGHAVKITATAVHLHVEIERQLHRHDHRSDLRRHDLHQRDGNHEQIAAPARAP
jgi:hypothetical protein